MINKNEVQARASFVLAAFGFSLCLSVANADDIDLYTAQVANQLKPNILFVLDYSGSMSDDVYGNDPNISGLTPRIDILKSALNSVLDENIDSINAGIGAIFNHSSSANRWPINGLNVDAHSIDPDIPVGQFTAREIISKQIEQHNASGETRTVSGLAEAALYMSGGPVLHDDRDVNQPTEHIPDRWEVANERYGGGYRESALPISYTPSDTAYAVGVNEPGNWVWCVNDHCDSSIAYDCSFRAGSTYTNAEGETTTSNDRTLCRMPHPDAWRGAQYISPISQTCQANAIILISDGEPTRSGSSRVIEEILGHETSLCEDLSGSIFGAGPGGRTEGNCGPEIVRELATNDQIPSLPGSTVKTYTVGFDVNGPGKNYLQRLADEGNGSFFEASAADDLGNAIREAIQEISGGSQSFTQFTIDVDRANFSNDNRVFFSLFAPNSGPAWTGNLKGYFIDSSGIVDTLGQSAVELAGGSLQFANSARSFWSSEADGNEVSKGGASQIVSEQMSRKLLTFTGDAIASGGVNLSTSTDHQLISSNTLITDAMMGLPSGSPLRQSSLDWLQTAPMGDPLHTLSLRVEYETQTVLYTMTNQGLLHAIDATTPTALLDHTAGSELFAFMPKRLLSNLPSLALPPAGGDHIYGLDGGLTRWHTDSNGDGIVNNSESVLLFFGMRRGGDSYYALDVSNPLSPILKWQIDSSTTGFSNLAQTWSKASLVTVDHGGSEERMLVFAGGYDATTVDDTNTPTPASGNAIYMVDNDGALTWSVTNADHSDLKYSIASDLTVIDSDNDGIADRIYAGDVGGQVWRIDFDDIDDSPVVTKLADFSSDGFHPFFYAPSIAINHDNGESFLSIALGSGNRTDPLNELSSNSLFMIRDEQISPISASASPAAITMSGLYDATDNDISSADPLIAEAAMESLKNANGWRINLATGEKSLSQIVTFEGTILATTFDTVSSSDPCSLDTLGRLYTVSVKTSEPVKYLADGSTSANQTMSADDRITELESGGIPSRPMVVFRADSGTADIYVDRQKVSVVDSRLRTIFWHAR